MNFHFIEVFGSMQHSKLLMDEERTPFICPLSSIFTKEKKMKKSVLTIALVVASLGMTAVQASEFDSLYIGGKVGLNRSDITGATTASKENVETFGFEEGYNWDMGGYLLGGSFFADFNQKTNHKAVAVYSGSTTIGLDLKLGLPKGKLMPYAKAGWDRTTGTGAYPASQFKYTNDLHLGLGVEYKIAPKWSVAGEWTHSGSKNFGSKLRNDNFTVGLNYYFAGPAPVAAAAPVAVVARPAPVEVKREEPKPAPKPAPKEAWKVIMEEKPVRIEGANFDSGSAKLKPTADAQLQQVVDFSRKYPDANLEVAGHTDDRGNHASNQKLSEKRAAAVKARLVKKGIAANRITSKGYGETMPVADNKTKEGRATNRRVEIRYTIREEKKVRVQ
ncbi:MAG TPA: OmpA family protein [Gallionella sp.]|nr:OmpA family protein [Gallionella sp.]